MRKLTSLLLLGVSVYAASAAEPVDYVSTLVGTESKYSLSTGNTYPAVAMPWGLNFWTPQTGKMGDGWTYTYAADKLRGFKQTHQPSPWINDYGQFSIMPVTAWHQVWRERPRKLVFPQGRDRHTILLQGLSCRSRCDHRTRSHRARSGLPLHFPAVRYIHCGA